MTGKRSERPDFAELYDRNFAKVYNYIRYRLAQVAETDDVTSRVFEKVLDRLETFDPGKAPVQAWIFAIARNTVNDHLRAKRWLFWAPWGALEESASDDPAPEQILLAREAREEVLSALKRLDARERDILALKFGARMTNRAIAAQTGLGESNVAVILYRAVKKLQSALKAKP